MLLAIEFEVMKKGRKHLNLWLEHATIPALTAFVNQTFI